MIKDDNTMKYLLKFLIRAMRTVDGKRGTAESLLRYMNHQSAEDYKELHKRQ